MEMEKSKVLIQFLVIFWQSGKVLFFLCARRLREYTATIGLSELHSKFCLHSMSSITFNHMKIYLESHVVLDPI